MPPELKGFNSHGIREPLTNRIAGILDEYPDGTQIARELLQNSDDARSTVQWYLLDHHDHRAHPDRSQLKLFHEDLSEYMGPALLAGSDSLFEEKDFKSMKNLAASEKRADVTKIGQMGIGFNSIYHLTDCPSFISGDQFMVIEPHERIFNGNKSRFTEGAVRGSFVHERQGLEFFPDQLKTFSVIEDIEFSKPYAGTIFRFPLRTKAQAETSLLSKYAYPAEKVLEMLLKLKDEALKGMLFLKHLERIVIYERKETDDIPVKLFEIEIVNAEQVREERLRVIENLQEHVHPENPEIASRDAILEYSVCPTFKLTQDDGSMTEERWQITGLVGNVIQARENMAGKTDGDLANHKLIPWVGIAAPLDPGSSIDSSRLFCFLPIGIQLPFPVHINGHFAVKQSRREIWTNQDNDFGSQASANIKSLWNVHLFDKHVPEVYAMFLEKLGITRGASYDMWPLTCGNGLGLDAVWKDVLNNLLEVVIDRDNKVFFCGTEERSDQRVVSYGSSWIAGRDLDEFPLLVDALHGMVSLVAGLPDVVLAAMPRVVESLETENRILTPALVRDLLQTHKEQWSLTASAETRVQMLNYCIRDDEVEDLEGLPLLPLVGDLWVEFSKQQSSTRHLVTDVLFRVLIHSPEGLVDTKVENLPIHTFISEQRFKVFWSNMTYSLVATRVKDMFRRLCYMDASVPSECISQSADGFPTDEWLSSFWAMSNTTPQPDTLPKLLAGYHLFPILDRSLAPITDESPILHCLNGDNNALQPVSRILNKLGCRFLRDLDPGSFPDVVTSEYLVALSEADKTLRILFKQDADRLRSLSQGQSRTISDYVAHWLPIESELDSEQLYVLRTLPLYLDYENVRYISLEGGFKSDESILKVACSFSHADKPWVPASVTLLADGQPMLKHLTNLLKVPIMKESEYWFQVMSNLVEFAKDDWDSIMRAFCQGFYSHRQDYSFKAVLTDVPFVRVKGLQSHQKAGDIPILKSPRSTVLSSLSPFFLRQESVFADGIYAEDPIYRVLQDLGMQTKFDAQFVKGRIRVLTSPELLNSDDERNSALNALYARLNADCTAKLLSQDLHECLRTTPWILAKSPNDREPRLCTPFQCRPASENNLLGSQMPLSTFNFTNEALLDCMRWNAPPPLDKVLSNLVAIVERATSDKSGNARPLLDDTMIIAIYRYLLGQVSDDTALKTAKAALNSRPWILINGTLHTADRVALKMNCDLSPHFVQITLSNLDSLFLAMGVREYVRQEDFQEIIGTVASKYSADDRLSIGDIELVIKLLESIANGASFQWSPDLLILTEHSQLRKITEVVFDDVNARSESTKAWEMESSDMAHTFANLRISRHVAERLQINMFSAQHWQRDSTFETWAQQEDIVDRIHNVLNDYDPSSVLTEFLQNSADAGATECVFMLDYDSYGTSKTLSKEMAAWQGPALMIYNNAEFSQGDFQALSKIGVGNKRENASKIGRHGLGFNSVYHFTDVPSVVSGSYIGFFDPQLTNLPKIRTAKGLVGEGGQRCDFRKLKGDVLSDQLAPYKGVFGCDMESHFNGTIFRIPLRTLESQRHAKSISRFSDHVWTVQQMHDLLKSWFEDAKVSMLFLTKVVSVKILASKAFTWSASKKNVTESFGIRDSALKKGDCSTSTEIIRITIDSQNGTLQPATTETKQWLVHLEDGLPPSSSASIKALTKKYCWSTHRGVAFPLVRSPGKLRDIQGRLFAHLPTPILSHVPFHIHGMFALMSNRKSLAGGSEEGNPMARWNAFVLGECLPLTAALAFETLLKWCFRSSEHGGPKHRDLDDVSRLYFEFMPKGLPKGAPKEIASFVENFWHQALQRPIFPCRTKNQEQPIIGVKGSEAVFPSNRSIPSEVEPKLQSWLRDFGVLFCGCPRDILTMILNEGKGEFGHTIQQVDENMIRKYIRKDPLFIPTHLKTTTGKQWILEYALKVVIDKSEVETLEPLSGLALLPLVNGEWKPLFPTPVYYTADREMRSIIEGGDMLVNEDLLSTDILQKILAKLTIDEGYGLEKMSAKAFATAYQQEHPNGVPPETWERLWTLLGKFEDLEPFENMSILKTEDGTMKPLKEFRNGLQVSSATIQGLQCIQNLRSLLKDLGIIVFDARHHRNHPYIVSNVPACDACRVLTLISRCLSTWPDSREITRDEAVALKEAIYSFQDSPVNPLVARNLGFLRIWNSYGSLVGGRAPLTAAQGSLFAEGGYNLSNLGDNRDVIRDRYCELFLAMGAQALTFVNAVGRRVVPKFLDGSLSCTGETKAAYLRMLHELVRIAIPGGRKTNSQAKNFLLNGRCILARGGTFHRSADLFDPEDHLVSQIFHHVPSSFPDDAVWSVVRSRKNLFAFRKSSDTGVVKQCAEQMLLQASAQPSPDAPMVRTKAAALVNFIYQHCEGPNWMDPKWRIVPADLAQSLPYSDCVPSLPKYLSFSELVLSSYRDIVWTQCAFFPESLKPSEAFKRRNPNVGIPSIQSVVNHLSILVKDLAPKWVTTERQLALKMSLFKVYECLNDFASTNAKSKSDLADLLGRIQAPYILNGDSKDSAKKELWLWPSQLMLDIDNDIERHQVVHAKLQPYREFLVAAGVEQMHAVEGFVDVPKGREVGDIENRLYNCFETQDRYNGFMDVRFKFAGGQEIMAHKFILVHSNEYFSRRFTGIWADYTTREEAEPGVEVIDLSSHDEAYEAFWGLVYFFYTDQLIQSNGPPFVSVDGSVTSRLGQNNEEQAYTDDLRDRMQYLMALQHLADQYMTPRLKKLIASEIVANRKVIHSNVFSVRGYAVQNQCKDLQNHCEKYIRKNSSGVRKYVEGDLAVFKKDLNALSKEDHGAQRAELREWIADLEQNLKELDAFS
ncbi:hypothetical protein BGX28_003528 [Mortierella sp. GBA30]|nr:hypothetical protein BGX28_003528 [Mortierella sp. GBA30]